jgi:hypothetical protein
MATNIRSSNYNYSITEHSYIFLSILYAYLLSVYLNDIYAFIKQFDLRQIDHVRFITLGWSLFLLFLILNSWWGSWIDQKKIICFFDFVVFLIIPILLFFGERLVLDLHLFDNSLFNAIFFLLIFIISACLAYVRWYFDRRVKILEARNIVIFTSLIALVVILSSPISTNWLFSLNYLFIAICGIVLLRHILYRRNRLAVFSADDFMEAISPLVSMAYRAKMHAGFAIFDSTAVKKQTLNNILIRLRHNDVWAVDDNKIYYIFLSGSAKLKKIEQRLRSNFADCENSLAFQCGPLTGPGDLKENEYLAKAEKYFFAAYEKIGAKARREPLQESESKRFKQLIGSVFIDFPINVWRGIQNRRHTRVSRHQAAARQSSHRRDRQFSTGSESTRKRTPDLAKE